MKHKYTPNLYLKKEIASSSILSMTSLYIKLKRILFALTFIFFTLNSFKLSAQASITLVPTPPSCNGFSDGIIDVALAGLPDIGFGYHYSISTNPADWSNTAGNFTGLSAGPYTICATNSGTLPPLTSEIICTSITLTEPLPLSINFIATPSVGCIGSDGGITAMVSGGELGFLTEYEAEWTNTGGIILPDPGNYLSISSLVPGTYSLTVTDYLTCSLTKSYNLNSLCLELYTPVHCHNGLDGAISATTSMTGSLLFKIDNSSYTSYSLPAIFSGLASGTHTVCVTNGSDTSCNTFTLTNPPALAISFTATPSVSCLGNDGGITALVSGGELGPLFEYEAEWTNSSNVVIPPNPSNYLAISSLTPGTYNLEVKDYLNCTLSKSYNLNSLCLELYTPVHCHNGLDGAISATTSMTGSLLFNIDNGSYTSYSLPAIFSGLASGTHTVCVTNGSDTTCNTFTLTNPPALAISFTATPSVSCLGNDGGITAIVSGGELGPLFEYEAEWTNSSNVVIPPNPSNYLSISSLTPGAYNLEVKDYLNCTLSKSYNLNSLCLELYTPVHCHNGLDGAISATTSMTGSLLFKIDNSSYTSYSLPAIFSGLASGTHTVCVTNGADTACNTFTLANPPALAISFTASPIVGCVGNNGGITAIVSGGELGPLFEYEAEWTNSSNVVIPPNPSNYLAISSLTPGTYNLEVKDYLNCTLSKSFNLPSLCLTIAANNTCAENPDGAIQATAPLFGPWLFGIDGGAMTNNTGLFTGLSIGTHTICMTDGVVTYCDNILLSVVDLVPPSIACPSNISVSNTTGFCSAVVTYATPVGTDNCVGSTTTQTAGLSSGSTFPVGVTTNTFLVTDASGNTATCSFTVTVNDTELPVITCPTSGLALNVDAGECNATATFAASATDNCSVSGITYAIGLSSISFPYDFPVGSTTVTATATDVNGNSSSCNFTVVVTDNINPVITCPTSGLALNVDAGECNATATFAASATDNCSVSGITYAIGLSSISFPYDFPVGSTTVTATATDVNGNSSSCNFTVVVTDNINPVITCPTSGLALNVDAGECNATATFAASATDNCSVSGITYAIGLSSISFPYDFPVGSTTVTATATDVNGNSSSCNFTVVVTDNINPVITCPTSGLALNVDAGECNATATFAASATDNCSVSGITYAIGLSSISFPYDFPVGSTTVTATATDVNGNSSSCNFTVVVTDNINPVITCPTSGLALNVDAGECNATATFAASATDNCSVSGITYAIGLSSISFPYDFPVGSTTVTATATDVNGNSSSCNFTVVVTDNINPVITCPTSGLALNVDAGECNATATFAASATDNCSVSGITYAIGLSSISFPYDFPVGSTTVTATATDVNGNSSSCNFTVVVTDNINPVITCPTSGLALNVDAGECNATATFAASATDNCSVSGITYAIGLSSISFPYDFPVGSTTVTATATDVNGNSSSCNFTVVVTDNINPVITCPTSGLALNVDAGECNATATFAASATDNCSVSGITYAIGLSSISFPYDFPVGSTTVTATATDVNGNSSSCNFTVVVTDNINPVITCPTSGLALNVDAGECNATATFAASATDNCSVSGITYAIGLSSISFPYDFPVGSTTVTATATDVNGNSSSCNFTVVVTDNINPVITCPTSGLALNVDAGECNATATFAASATDNCSVSGITYAIGLSSISFPYDFPVGSTTVTATATDVNGNSSSCNFTVVVTDNINPVITCPTSGLALNVDAGECNATATFAASATDNCSVSGITYAIGLSSISFPYDFPVGSTTVTATATDVNGNSSSCNFTVVVTDNINPVITCPTSGLALNVDAGECNATATFAASATDNCSVSGITYAIGLSSISFPYDFPVGSTTVTATATDVNGNSSSCNFTVVVTDNINPVITCPTSGLALNVDAGECNATATFAASATDNCSVSGITYAIGLSSISFPYDFPVGSTTVTATATDVNGNSSSCNFTVVVTDNINPVITCPTSGLALNVDAGECNATATFAASATDNCSVSGITYAIGLSSISFPYDFPVGSTTVTATATDVNGNSSSCNFTVVVTDNINPVITCPTSGLALNVDAGECNATATFAASATDNCSVSGITYAIGLSSISFPYDFPVGSTTVTATATDVNGNSSSCNFTVVVTDNINPVITCPTSGLALNVDAGECNATATFAASATDNCSVSGITYAIGLSSISFPYDFPVGSTTVTATATDVNGNSSSCNFTVVVTDNINPVITCPTSGLALNVDAGECNATATFAASATDNCSVSGITYAIGLSSISFPYDFPVGSTTVTATATDVNGNSSSCNFTVVVTDNINPVITCPTSGLALNVDAGECNATATFAASATDNCSVSGITYAIGLSSISFPYDFPVGSTTVTATATDVNGNSSSCNFTVVVTDNINPVITCPTSGLALNVDAGECNATATFAASATDNCSVSGITYAIGLSSISFPYDFPVGSTTVTATATDVNGNSSSCNFTVVVTDNINPVITCPTSGLALNVDAGECNATATFAASATDNCSVSGITYAIGLSSISFPYDFPVGSTTVTATATDVNGNSSSCNFTVVVTDNINPVITCPTSGLALNVDAGECNATATFAASATDNCSVSGITYAIGLSSISFPYDFPVGSTTVTATATDVNGNSSSCNFTVVVTDNINPVITCPTSGLALNVDAGECNATATFAASATDNCSVSGITYAIGLSSISFPYDFPVGSTTVTATATDVNGNSSSCNFTVVVTDNINPVITCPTSGLALNVDAGECNATATFAASATDNCSVSGITYAIGLSSISFPYDFPVGSTTVTATATDVNGNSSSCNFTVVVTDNINPVITCPTSGLALNVDAGECNATATFAASATDNCSVSGITYAIGLSSISFPYDFPVGSTTVTATATDVNGNSSSCNFTVVVTDNINPVITCPTSGLALNVDAGECNATATFAASATDNCSVSGITYAIGLSSISFPYDFPVGSTTVTATATDVNGNSSSCNFTVVVTDNILPTITCNAPIIVNNDPNLCSATITVSTPSASDNCTVVTITNSINGTSNASGIYPIGNTNIIWTATDASGNTSTCSQLISVISPEMDVKGNSISIVDGDITPNVLDQTDFDNVGILSSLTKTFEIHNTGTSNLVISAGAFSLTGANAATFAVTGITLPATIGVGNFISFDMTFTPGSIGIKTATLHIANNDCNENAYDFDVKGNGSCAPSNNSPEVIDVCNSYLWSVTGLTYTNSGTFTQSFTNSSGCDSTRVLNLTIRNSTSSSFSVSNHGCYTWTVSGVTYTISGIYTATLVNSSNCDSIITLNLTITPGVLLIAKALLDGPYDSGSGLMHDSLRSQGLISNTEPYTASPYFKTPLGGASGETVSSAVLAITGNDAIVDWIFLELRSASNPSIVVANKRALIQRDGDIVSHIDGVSPVSFSTVYNGYYYVSVKHRNHLGLMTVDSMLFMGCLPAVTIDFSDLNPVYTNLTITNPPRKLVGATNLMWAGDANNNKNVKYNGLSNDKEKVLSAVGLSTINTTILNVYRVEDLNMDGMIRYNFSNNDRGVILSNVGVSTPNVILGQHTPN